MSTGKEVKQETGCVKRRVVVNLGFAAQCADGGDCGAAASGEFRRAENAEKP
jgi:hypothetical protein